MSIGQISEDEFGFYLHELEDDRLQDETRESLVDFLRSSGYEVDIKDMPEPFSHELRVRYDRKKISENLQETFFDAKRKYDEPAIVGCSLGAAENISWFNDKELTT